MPDVCRLAFPAEPRGRAPMTEWPSPLAARLRDAAYTACVLAFAATVWLMVALRDVRDGWRGWR